MFRKLFDNKFQNSLNTCIISFILFLLFYSAPPIKFMNYLTQISIYV